MISFKHLIRVMNFVRLYDYKQTNVKLWLESADLVREKLGSEYMAAWRKTMNYRELRTAQDRTDVFQSFFELAERFSNIGDTRGFCESAIKLALFHMSNDDAPAAKRIIETAILRYRETINHSNEFSVIYEPNPIGLLGSGIPSFLTGLTIA